MNTVRKNLVIVSLIVLASMLFISGCVTHAEFTAGAAKSGNQAAANISASTPSGDHSSNASGVKSSNTTTKETTGRSARDLN